MSGSTNPEGLRAWGPLCAALQFRPHLPASWALLSDGQCTRGSHLPTLALGWQVWSRPFPGGWWLPRGGPENPYCHMTPCAVLSPRFPGRKLRKDCLQGQAAASRAWCYTVTIVLPPDLCKEALASTDNPLEVVARGRSLWLLGSRAQAQ